MSEVIGLVTFSSSYNNYGQVLQAYATQEYLKSHGHNVFLIREVESKKGKLRFWLKVILKKILFILTHSQKVRKSLESQMRPINNNRAFLEEEKKHPRFFEEFRQKHFQIIKSSNNDLKNNKLSVLCAGSDQIWGRRGFFYLSFGDDKLKKISIASSTGNKVHPPKTKSKIAQWLKPFSFVTVREASGVKLCKEVGRIDAIQILDPTFLLNANSYNLLIPENERLTEDYIFVYLLKAPSSLSFEEIGEFASQNGLQIKYVTGQGRVDDFEKIYATVPEWLKLLRDAKYIITNSFHGMAFSIIYQKQFMVLPRLGESMNMNERIEDLAAQMNLENRIYKNGLHTLFDEIDYTKSIQVISNNHATLDFLMSKFGL